MRCHVCNVTLAEPTYNTDHGDWDPCGTCLEVIQDTLDAFNDRPAMAEDESGFAEIPLEHLTTEDIC